MGKQLFIKTWGCQMNVYDSTRMADALAPLGYTQAESPDTADMIILNTCHIREKATEKLFSELGRLKKYKDEKESGGKTLLLAVAGCVAQAEGEVITQRAPYVDIVFGPQTYHQLPEMVVQALDGYGHKRIVNTEFPTESKFDHLPEENRAQGPMAYLSIQEGCDKFCTFCVVPYTRGAEFSRPVSDVLAEAKRLVANGAKEINLLGQNVNAYHGSAKDGTTWGLAQLIRHVAEIDGVARIRYTTSHPRDMDDDLIAAHGEIDKLMPFLHLPVQHGSDRILKIMNRKHTANHYREIIAKLRAARSDIVFSSDFIVGFPGETEDDFEATLQLVKDIQFASCYSFKYSPRPGTPGANMAPVIHETIKSERLARLQALLNEQQHAFNTHCVGMTLPVLLERKGLREGQLQGRSPWMHSVHVEAPDRLIGNIADVTITRAGANSLTGDIATFSQTQEAA